MGRSEKIAVEEIARTEVHPVHAWCAIISFFILIIVVGLADLRLFSSIPPANPTTSEQSESSSFLNASPWVKSVFDWNQGACDWIKRTEDHVSTESPFSRAVQPWVQTTLLMTGEGGGDVMVGQEGWLFYRPSYRFLTRPDENIAGASGYAAALKAILAFSEDLRIRGIQLVIVPAWPKLAIHSEKFGAGHLSESPPLMPSFYPNWRKQLEEAGVLVFDSSSALLEAKASHPDGTYLKTDSHWNPLGMKRAAEGLGAYLEEMQLASTGTVVANETQKTIRNSGDLLRMLRLPDRISEPMMESVEISIVRHADGSRWLSDRNSPILVLGDSFCNIFSLEGMGWGENAGFTEQLGAALGQPVDAILRNGDGAHATRALLARELNAGRDRLAGKKVVVWEFAASQITEGTWPIIPCRENKAAPQTFNTKYLEVADEETQEMTCMIALVGTVPNPNSTVYKEYVGHLLLESLEMADGSPAPSSRALVYGLVMRDHKLTALASLRPNQRVKMKLRSWSSAEEEFGRYQRSEPAGDLALEPVNWLESFSLVD